VHTKKFHLEERRRQVATLLAQSLTEQEIADKLGVDRSEYCNHQNIEIQGKLLIRTLE
jgi:transposase